MTQLNYQIKDFNFFMIKHFVFYEGQQIIYTKSYLQNGDLFQ